MMPSVVGTRATGTDVMPLRKNKSTGKSCGETEADQRKDPGPGEENGIDLL